MEKNDKMETTHNNCSFRKRETIRNKIRYVYRAYELPSNDRSHPKDNLTIENDLGKRSPSPKRIFEFLKKNL